MKPATKPSAIPQFGLYGERAFKRDPGFVHIEDIAKRSSPSGWLIAPHRHGGLFQVLYMLDGGVDLHLDDSHHHLAGCKVITIPVGVVHGFRFTPGTDGGVLTIAEPLLNDAGYREPQGIFAPLMQAPRVLDFQRDDALLQEFLVYLAALEREINEPELGSGSMVEWLVRAALMTLRRQVDRAEVAVTAGDARHRALVRFKALLNEHYREQWRVEQYADAINVSVSTLNRLCRELLGITAKAVIQDRLLNEIKRRLIYTTEPLDQLAFSLGFKDPAYFSRFFRKHTGSSPSDYRHHNNYQTR